MSEKALADRVMKILKPLHGIRVENPCLPGTPDVNCVGDVWIELKQQDKWPVKPETPLKLDHDYTPQQRLFAEKRITRGGKVYLLLQVDRDYLLLRGFPEAAELIGEATQAELKAAAIFCVSSRELPDALLKLLR